MFSIKGNLSIAMAVMLAVVLILAIGGAWAAPLLAGPVYLPYVPKQPTYTPTATPTPTRTPTPTPTRTATPVVTNPIANPGFENGSTGWVFQSNQGDPIRVSPFAHSGSFSAALGNGNHNRVASISQQFTVPFNNYNLQYWQYIQSNEVCGTPFDVVTIYINGANFQSFNVCSGLNSLDWSRAIINLISYRGDTIVFRMEFTSDGNTQSFFYVDDFSFIP
jgi:hypothetical protein